MKNIVEVVAALIYDENGRFMICQRPENKARPLLWEFVGGKVEKGESKEEALTRECHEELAITVMPIKEVFSTVYDYPDIKINLTLFESKIIKGIPTLLEHKDLKWILPEEAKDYTFCPADKPIIEKIVSNSNYING